MSLYNMVHGVNPATFYVLPMLGKHPDKYPRFRDCFVQERQFVLKEGIPIMDAKPDGLKDVIVVFLRVGGGNREDYREEIKKLKNHPCYVKDYDDEFDSTFAAFVFNPPQKWKRDYEVITKTGNVQNVSTAYRKELYRVFPKLKERFDEIFTGKKGNDEQTAKES